MESPAGVRHKISGGGPWVFLLSRHLKEKHLTYINRRVRESVDKQNGDKFI